MVLSFESVDKNLQCDRSKECIELYVPVLPFIMLVKVVFTFESVDEILRYDVFKDMKAIERGHSIELSSVRFTTIFFKTKFANCVRNILLIFFFFLTFLKQKHVMVVRLVEFYAITLYVWHTSFMNL